MIKYLKNNWPAILICVIFCPVILQAFTKMPLSCYGPVEGGNPYTSKPDIAFLNHSCINIFNHYTTWTVTYSNLSTGPTPPTVTGRAALLGQEVIGTIEVHSTAFTASRAGTTKFSLPYSAVGYAVAPAADATLSTNLYNGVLTGVTLYSPKWTTLQHIIMSFHYETKAMP